MLNSDFVKSQVGALVPVISHFLAIGLGMKRYYKTVFHSNKFTYSCKEYVARSPPIV